MQKVVLFLFLSFLLKVNGQYKEGIIYYKNGETKKGLIKERSSEDIKFKTNHKSKSIKLDYKKIKGYDINNSKYRYKYFNKSGAGKVVGFDHKTGKIIYEKNKKSVNTPKLLKLIIEGNTNLFVEEFTGGGFAISGGNGASFGGGTTTEYYIEKFGNITKIGTRIGNDQLKYFNDCKSLIEKIKSKEIRRNDVVRAINFYNNKCEEK
jgi:hypothetical protein